MKILDKEHLIEIGNLILDTTRSDIMRVQIRHSYKAISRVSNNRVLLSDNGTNLEIVLTASVGGRAPVSLAISHVDNASLRSAIEAVDNLAKVQIGSPYDYLRVADGPQEYMPVSLWHDSTADVMAVSTEVVTPRVIQTLSASQLQGSGFIGMIARATLVMQKDGLVAFNRETDSECTVSARSSDGKASGWYGQAARDWNLVNPALITEKAVEIAKRGLNPFAVEPGRRVAILSPFALAQCLRFVSKHYDAYRTNRQHATAFAIQNDAQRDNKIGLRVFDRRVRITSDPNDPLGGYVPFGDIMWDGLAMPTKPMVYVDDGVLQTLSYSIFYGLREGQPFSQVPWSMRFEAKPGVPTLTVEEMISNCRDGIYVNRFSNVSQIGGITGLQTGVTRDGCFLIRNGKIDKPVKNLRFADSPFFFLNRVVAIGQAERVAPGFVAPEEGEPTYASEWPRRPMIVPPVMVTDFNFTALSEAV